MHRCILIIPEHGDFNIHKYVRVMCGYCICVRSIEYCLPFMCYYNNNIMAAHRHIASHNGESAGIHCTVHIYACYQPLRQLTLQVLQSCALYVKLNIWIMPLVWLFWVCIVSFAINRLVIQVYIDINERYIGIMLCMFACSCYIANYEICCLQLSSIN